MSNAADFIDNYPWRVGPAHIGIDAFAIYTGPDLGDGKGVIVAHVQGSDQPAVREKAALISAAPDMLAALKTTAENIRSLGPAGALANVFTPYLEWLALVEAAIAKAEGR